MKQALPINIKIQVSFNISYPHILVFLINMNELIKKPIENRTAGDDIDLLLEMTAIMNSIKHPINKNTLFIIIRAFMFRSYYYNLNSNFVL